MTYRIATYRGWRIAIGQSPESAFTAIHPDYDASYEGPEYGWVGNGLSATGATLDEVKAEIDDIEDGRCTAFEGGRS